jgi:hypothetical protein
VGDDAELLGPGEDALSPRENPGCLNGRFHSSSLFSESADAKAQRRREADKQFNARLF